MLPSSSDVVARLKPWAGSPADLARWAFWVPFRNALDPARPEHVRRLSALWRPKYAAARGQRARMAQEYERCLGHTPEHALQDAYRVAWRVHLEELLLGQLTEETWPNFLRFEGRENLDAALERGKGAIILFPHAGNFMMMIASVSLAGYPYTQYAARGLPPSDVAAEHPEIMGHNRWREITRQTREDNEDRLPASFISLDTPVRHLYRCLGRNEVVGIAFDGRIGKRFIKVPYLGREALINPGPYRLAASTGAAIVPTLCHTPADGPGVCTFGAPIHGKDWRDMCNRYVQGVVDPWIRQHPGEYGTWLAHCLERRAIDDHPFFIDYAPDDRWKVHDR